MVDSVLVLVGPREADATRENPDALGVDTPLAGGSLAYKAPGRAWTERTGDTAGRVRLREGEQRSCLLHVLDLPERTPSHLRERLLVVLGLHHPAERLVVRDALAFRKDLDVDPGLEDILGSASEPLGLVETPVDRERAASLVLDAAHVPHLHETSHAVGDLLDVGVLRLRVVRRGRLLLGSRLARLRGDGRR